MSITKTKTKLPQDFSSALSTYYKLKGSYQGKINKSVKEIYNNTELNLEQKREKYSQIKKKCVVCGKTGGTIFTETNTMLTAKCGNLETPCKLDIKLERAKYDNIIKSLSENNKMINNYKNDIIDTKLDYLFGFTNHSVTITKFEELKNNLVKIVKIYQDNTNRYLSTIYNLENKAKIISLNNQLDANIISFKDNIFNYNESGEISYLQEAVQLYVNTIKIINKEISKSKYKLQAIYKSQDSDVISLIQKSYTLSDLQIKKDDTENRVISFSV